MGTSQNPIYHEEQKLKTKSLVTIFVPGMVVFIIMSIALFLYGPRPVFWMVGGFGIFFLMWMYLMITPMVLQISLSKQGLLRNMIFSKIFKSRKKEFSWDQIKSVQIIKYPHGVTRYGRQISYKGEAYVMTSEMMGIELTLNNNEKEFFTCNSPEDFIKAIKKLELNIQIIK